MELEEKIKQAESLFKAEKAYADQILSGDRDNYDGADGARNIRHVCSVGLSMLEEFRAKLVDSVDDHAGFTG